MTRRIAGLLVVALLVFGGRSVLNAPVDSRSTEQVAVEITSGLGVRDIARRLKDAGVLRSELGFVVQASVRGAREKLQAGTYVFTKGESGQSILSRLRRGDAMPADISVTIPEGFTLGQIADRLAAHGIARRDEFLAVATVSRFRGEFETVLADAPAQASLEGYLFPDTYRFDRGTSAEEVARRLLKRFQEQWKIAQRESGFGGRESDPTPDTQHSTPTAHQIVTIASIIEREVRTNEDRRLVSGILWKRLDAGVGLAADATIRYVLNNWEQPLTVQDLQVDSPYNTRRYRGLPPGPIGNPGLESLRSALAPSASPYLYYLSARDGTTIFSKTLDEHNRAKAQYLSPASAGSPGRSPGDGR